MRWHRVASLSLPVVLLAGMSGNAVSRDSDPDAGESRTDVSVMFDYGVVSWSSHAQQVPAGSVTINDADIHSSTGPLRGYRDSAAFINSESDR
jgi:hypothetical protein